MPDYNSPKIADLDRDMGELGPERVALNLANNHNWGQVWSTILGVEAKRARERRKLGFCIADNWHISFTESARCGQGDVDLRRILVDTATAGIHKNLPELFTSDNLRFVLQPARSCLSIGTSWSIAEESIPVKDADSTGWSVPEGDFVWTLGNNSKLPICVDDDVKALKIDLGAFLPNPTYKQLIRIRAGSGPEMTEIFDAGHPRRQVLVPLEPGHGHPIDLVLSLPNAISPKETGLSQDSRVLGVSLYAIDAE